MASPHVDRRINFYLNSIDRSLDEIEVNLTLIRTYQQIITNELTPKKDENDEKQSPD